jgi:hypothetical protein
MGFFGGGGSVDLASPPAIGSTTPNTGAFTTLSFAPPANTSGLTSTSYSVTGTNSTNLVSLSGTWNTTGTPKALLINITNTASNFDSRLIDLQAGGSSRFYVRANGEAFFGGGATEFNAGMYQSSGSNIFGIQNGFASISSTSGIRWSSTSNWQASHDLFLLRDGAAGTLAQRNSTNAQTFRLYNTFTDASNYERGFFRWNTNVLEIGAEAAGTGTQRQTRVLCNATNNSVALGNTSTAGFGVNGDGTPAIVVSSSERFSVSASLLALQNDANFGISFSSGLAFQADTFIRRDGTGNTLAMRNGTSNQTLRLYRTFTDASNYERLAITATGTTRFGILVQNAGTGSARSLEVSFYTSASDPTSTDITSGCFSVWKNSGTGTIKLWANDGGTMKSVALA